MHGCRSLCPQNELALTSNPELALDLFEVFSYAVLSSLVIWVLVAARAGVWYGFLFAS